MNTILNIKTYEQNTLLFKETTTGYLEDNILNYSTDIDNIKINLKEFSFTKENNETILKITKESCLLMLKELNTSLEIPLDYINYSFDNNKNIIIEYKLESQEKPLKIIIEMSEKNDIQN